MNCLPDMVTSRMRLCPERLILGTCLGHACDCCIWSSCGPQTMLPVRSLCLLPCTCCLPRAVLYIPDAALQHSRRSAASDSVPPCDGFPGSPLTLRHPRTPSLMSSHGTPSTSLALPRLYGTSNIQAFPCPLLHASETPSSSNAKASQLGYGICGSTGLLQR